MHRPPIVAAAALAALLAAPPAMAISCAGFADVDPASAFCPDVEWLRNRAITRGCTTTSVYCPNDTVTRLQMAAFIARLGRTLEPVALASPDVFTSTVVDLTLSFGTVAYCQVPAFTAVDYPRRVRLTGFVAGTTDVAQDLNVDVMYSTNAGASWLITQQPYNIARFSPTGWQSVSVASTYDIPVGQTVRFGLLPARWSPETATTATVQCRLFAEIISRTGATSPLDEPPAAPGRGPLGR